jgi:hypothetical protein
MSRHRGAKGRRQAEVTPVSVAYHEAGHVVAYLSNGVRVLSASIKEGSVQKYGAYEGYTKTELDIDISIRNLAIIAMAGPVADCVMVGASEDMLKESAENDYVVAETLISTLTLSSDDTSTIINDRIISETFEFVKSHCTEIETFAEALLSEGTLDEGRIMEIWGCVHSDVLCKPQIFG